MDVTDDMSKVMVKFSPLEFRSWNNDEELTAMDNGFVHCSSNVKNQGLQVDTLMVR